MNDIFSVVRLQVTVVVLALCQGCSPGTGVMGAKAVPNGRLEVGLSESISHYDLFSRMNDAAFRAGFTNQRHNAALAPDYVETLPRRVPPDAKIHGYTWYPTAESSVVTDYSVHIYWEEHGPTTTSFTFIFNQGGSEPFQAVEWLLFFRWKEVLIPAAFSEVPVSTTISTHPVVFTECNDMESISYSTGIEIPLEVDWCEDQTEASQL